MYITAWKLASLLASLPQLAASRELAFGVTLLVMDELIDPGRNLSSKKESRRKPATVHLKQREVRRMLLSETEIVYVPSSP